jgi:pyrimidine-specific ribonucleoside hydrolase
VFVVSMCAIAVLATCAPQSAPERSAAPTPLIVDTDGGSDDAMALLYLLQDPSVDVEAITVSGTGLVHCPIGAANVAGLVALAAAPSAIPIACGPAEPIEGSRSFPDDWRTQADGRYGGILPSGEAPAASIDAVGLLLRVGHDAPRPVTVLTLGPLTNLALALDADPSIVREIDHVVVMGGAFSVPGNVLLDAHPSAAIAEWNVFVDPVAAERVLDSAVPVTFVPLDTQVPVDAYVVRAIARSARTASAHVVADLLTSSPFFVSGQFFFWDPLAAAAAVHPSLFTTHAAQVSVVTDGGGAGWTTVGEGARVEIAAVVEGEAFIDAYTASLNGGTTPVAVSPVPDAVIAAGAGCSVTPSAIAAGASVLVLASPSAVVAVGTIEKGRTDAEIEAFLATSPTGPPPWFALSALLETGDAPASTLVELHPGDLTVVCLGLGAEGPQVTGRAALHVG